MAKQFNVALIGNPNTGKTSLFNQLTGLNQKAGNYPGITVEKKEGICKLPRGVKAHILDLPGTYSLSASSLDENFGRLEQKELQGIASFKTESESHLKRLQQKETIIRYKFINEVLKETVVEDPSKATDLRARLDRILTHKVWGYVIFFAILLLIFQAIYDWASYPMDYIDLLLANLSELTKTILPSGALTHLLADGIIAGLGGIIIFIPQIAFLFLFIAILEETGYMSRVVFLMDRVMRPFGLSGKSVVPLISGTVCAILAIMAARNIESWKERLITILITPFTTCSARLPV